MNNPTRSTVTPSTSRFAIARSRAARLVIGCALLLTFTCGAYAKAPKWEYLVVSAGLSNRPLAALLNTHGAEGWELVQINVKGIAIFKRRR
jgi:hypothetical protein